MKRAGFTMIELIFVIVILGILAAVAVPKLSGIKDDAQLANANENICVNLKGSMLSFAVRHDGSLADFNMTKYLDLSTTWYSDTSKTAITGTTGVINTTNGLIDSGAASASITPFLFNPDNSVYVYFVDGNASSSPEQTYGCLIGSEASYTKSASELRAIITKGSNYL